ncbi:hypothetical protein [Methylotenera sp.]|uniref:hypothetical protein n=1 Tax=Methylotenera sp. TaxID=2051956 RepID=UPI0024880669|nr:hypothetical protein [Methylotenera sp.]MDI1360631.1 hypothetical protein [Methylotenera sp.]
MLERLADEVDAASVQEAKFTNASIAGIQALLAPQKHPDFVAPFCLDCTDEIPEERLAAGRIRCTHCESILEQASKLRRRK